MQPKMDRTKLWRVISLNLIVVAVGGLIAISLPTLIQKMDSHGATEQKISLVCTYQGDAVHSASDYYYVWQIYETVNGKKVTSWEEIYQAYRLNHNLVEVSDNLTVTPQGLVYKPTTARPVNDFQGWVRYLHRTVVVRLP